MKLKEITLRVRTSVLTLGLNNQLLVIDGEHWSAKQYFKLICPTYYSLKHYHGNNRFTIVYEVKNG